MHICDVENGNIFLDYTFRIRTHTHTHWIREVVPLKVTWWKNMTIVRVVYIRFAKYFYGAVQETQTHSRIQMLNRILDRMRQHCYSHTENVTVIPFTKRCKNQACVSAIELKIPSTHVWKSVHERKRECEKKKERMAGQEKIEQC